MAYSIRMSMNIQGLGPQVGLTTSKLEVLTGEGPKDKRKLGPDRIGNLALTLARQLDRPPTVWRVSYWRRTTAVSPPPPPRHSTHQLTDRKACR